MGFFNNLFNIEKAPTVTKTVSAPYVPPYPLEKDFYTFDKVEWSGALPPHSMTLSFVLPIPIGANLKSQTFIEIWRIIFRNYKNEVTRMRM